MNPEADDLAPRLAAMRDEFRAHVMAWTIFGVVLMLFAMFGLAVTGLFSPFYDGLLVLWGSMQVLIASAWIWRRQIVPFRVNGQIIAGPAARRWAVTLAVMTVTFFWIQIAGTTYFPRARAAILAALASDPPRVPVRARDW